VSDIESTQVTVHWDPVAGNSIMGELKEYKVSLPLCSVRGVTRPFAQLDCFEAGDLPSVESAILYNQQREHISIFGTLRGGASH